jgi:hypothetical protein
MVAGPFSRGALASENVATAMAFDHNGDYGVFNVSTLEAARRRGLGTALRVSRPRCRRTWLSTASLQSSALGRILEYVP